MSGSDHTQSNRASAENADAARFAADRADIRRTGAERTGTDRTGTNRTGADCAEAERSETARAGAAHAGAGHSGAGGESAKPPGSTWTDEQWEAIRLRGSDILVAAAAGSGKTAVLVERIIRRIADERDPVDVDRLLVATFTNAAAGEMRERIREALEKRLRAHPGSAHLRRQIALIHRASITTLHSFCLDVIRQYGSRIGLDPAFRIANETEAELMRQDVLSDLLEEHYGQSGEDSPFWRLADAFGGDRGDDALFRLIQKLYDFSRSHPWPDYWLNEMVSRFEREPSGQGENNVWQTSLVRDVRLELQGIAGVLREAIGLAERPGGPAPYADNLRDDLAQIEAALRAADGPWDGLYRAVRETGFGKLNPCRGSGVDKALQERVKELRERAKKQFADIREELFERTPEQYARELRRMAPVVRKLADIVIEFGERYRRQKAAKGLVDFADLEHYCLQLLRHPDSTPERTIPSDAALEYRERFVEVLLDEYQDTNAVQEAIVELLSRPSPGNRFMVGDVKQSIYRFRLAEPGLFLAKYKAYGPAGAKTEPAARKDEAAGGGGDAPSEWAGALDASGPPGASSAEAGDGAAAPARPVPGRKIDLARNFRSRRQIVDGVNFLFRQLMSETVGEMEYDEAARLVCGAAYPDSPNDTSVELVLIDRGETGPGSDDHDRAAGEGSDNDGGEAGEGPDGTAAEPDLEQEEEQMETAQLEARYVAAHIRRLMGLDGEAPFRVYDRALNGTRPLAFRDIVVLLRATSQWAPVFLEELRLAGIPAYADLNTGYFTATEVEIVLSLLQIIDNPYQDIPLAAVLRSPMFGLTANDLARVRIRLKGKPFFDAVRSYAQAGDAPDDRLRHTLIRFLGLLETWQSEARRGALAELIWNVYRTTGFYDFVGGMPGGAQRQANLRALYDRARQYERTSLRGLFRFLRFIERMRESGADLGAARALGEQEDVVRIMSIHKSKGLEFPVVFVAGLGKSFNQTDLNGAFLLHKELGFGPMHVDTELRVGCPTLPMLAIRRRMKLELLAEEMRVLYVALTRPKEKMILLGTVKSLEKAAQKWGRLLEGDDPRLPAYELAKARSYLDWIGPAIIRHPQAQALRVRADVPDRVPACMAAEPSEWRIAVVPSSGVAQAAAAVEVRFADERMEAVAQLRPVPGGGGHAERLDGRLSWRYEYAQAQVLFSKTSVSELKRLAERTFGADGEEAGELWDRFAAPGGGTNPAAKRDDAEPSGARGPALQLFNRRPKFVERREMNAAERGTVYHAVMQHLPLEPGLSEETVRRTMDRMVSLQLITAEQREAVDPAVVFAFFREEIGQRLLRANRVIREMPFSYGLSAGEVYPGADDSVRGETVLVQGVIDCLFEENGGLVLLDYKTDAVYGSRLDTLKETYRPQLGLYARAIEHIWKRPVKEKALFFFDGPHLVRLD